MPAEKCLPVDEMTMQRARALSLMSRTMAGSSFQKSRIIEFIASGRLSWMWATLSSMLTSKQVQSRRGQVEGRGGVHGASPWLARSSARDAA